MERTTKSVVIRAFHTKELADKNVSAYTNDLLKKIDEERVASVVEVYSVTELLEEMQKLMKRDTYLNYAMCAKGQEVTHTRDFYEAKLYLANQ